MPKKPLLVVVLVLFGALSAFALREHGYMGIFMSPLGSLASTQIFFDLVIALSLVMVWMWQDAKAMGRNVWPWIAATLAFGSFGPLFYLLTRKSEKA
jgi:hypothetical protein